MGSLIGPCFVRALSLVFGGSCSVLSGCHLLRFGILILFIGGSFVSWVGFLFMRFCVWWGCSFGASLSPGVCVSTGASVLSF